MRTNNIDAHRLSPREESILSLAAEGLTDNAIAHELGISDGTVGTYWGRVRSKMGSYPRTELIALAIRHECQLKLDELSSQLQSSSDLAQCLCCSAVECAEDGILAIDSEGRIVYGNPATHRMFEYEVGTLVGRNLIDLIPLGLQESHLAGIERIRQVPELHRHIVGEGVTRTGRFIPVSIAVSVVTRGCGRQMIAFLTTTSPVS